MEYTEEDPKPLIEESCRLKCLKEYHAYKECAKRIESDTTGEAHCTGWYYDYYRCVDKCAAPKLFAALK